MSPLPARIDAEPETVGHDLGRLVLTIVELLRQLMERQAIRRVEAGALPEETVERLGLGLMRLEEGDGRAPGVLRAAARGPEHRSRTTGQPSTTVRSLTWTSVVADRCDRTLPVGVRRIRVDPTYGTTEQ